MKCIKTRHRSTLTNEHLEWLMITTIEGPRKRPGDLSDDSDDEGVRQGIRQTKGSVDKLSDEQADAIIDRFRDWPDKERHILL